MAAVQHGSVAGQQQHGSSHGSSAAVQHGSSAAWQQCYCRMHGLQYIPEILSVSFSSQQLQVLVAETDGFPRFPTCQFRDSKTRQLGRKKIEFWLYTM